VKYEYECEAGHVVEVEQRITDEPLTQCSARVRKRDRDESGACYGPATGTVTCKAPCRRLISGVFSICA